MADEQTNEASKPATETVAQEAEKRAAATGQPAMHLDDMQRTITSLTRGMTDVSERLAALEARPVPPSITADDVAKMLSDHPDMERFRAFLDRWQGQP